MVVEALGVQDLGELALVPVRLLELGPLVLEPDLELRLREAELLGEVDPPVLRQISVGQELLPQPLQLGGGEGGARPLVLLSLLPRLPGPGPAAGPVRVPRAEDPGGPQLTVGSPHHAWRTVRVRLRGLVRGLGQVHRDLRLRDRRAGGYGCGFR